MNATPPSMLDERECWREHAAKAPAVAEQLNNPTAKAAMLSIAEQYAWQARKCPTASGEESCQLLMPLTLRPTGPASPAYAERPDKRRNGMFAIAGYHSRPFFRPERGPQGKRPRRRRWRACC
jgi:hypothetical protein